MSINETIIPSFPRMKSLSNVKVHIYLLLDCVNLLLRENKHTQDLSFIDTSVIQDVTKRLTSTKNNQLVGDNSIVKYNLINLVNKLAKQTNLERFNFSSVILETVEVLSVDFDIPLIKETFTEGDDKEVISNLSTKLSDYVSRQFITSKFKKAIFDIENGANMETTLDELTPNIEKTINKTKKNSHVTLEITSDDIQSDKLEQLAEKASQALDIKVYRTGYQALNTALQGGLRSGQFTTVGAVPSNFKTGLNIRFFHDIARLNKPTVWKDGKKSAIIWFSFEDPIGITIKKLYQIIKKDETGVTPNLKGLEDKEVFRYVLEKMSETGFQIIMMKIDASDWSFRGLFREVEKIKQKYHVESITMDYGLHIPTTGCGIDGPFGSKEKELLRRISHYCENQNILLMTPLQLSSKAKDLLKNGVPDEEFVKMLPTKGYYEKCSGLDTEIFCEIFTHFVKTEGKSYLTIQVGKHKIETNAEEKDKHIILPFPRQGMPQSDLDSKPIHVYRIGDDEADNGSSLIF